MQLEDTEALSSAGTRRMPQSGSPAAGIAAGLAAGALWGLVFVSPRMVSNFGGVEHTVGRFVVYGASLSPCNRGISLNAAFHTCSGMMSK